ncbi:MAG: galactose-1-phosphate uridylyltransferase, partial [Clostridia bacterium]|nr:galactose-1-phosphate uridylyltransferase [Clostridia bacterium]
IEVMGLAVLPSRLKAELELLAEYLVEGKDLAANEALAKHAAWVASFAGDEVFTKENVHAILERRVGETFEAVLEDAGVYKCTPEGREAFMRFIAQIERNV